MAKGLQSCHFQQDLVCRLQNKGENMLELLAPAGNFERFETGLLYGADAFYLAGKSFGLRAFAGNFTNEEIKKACELAHKKGKKVYVTLNIVAKDEDFEGLDEYAQFLVDAKVDGVIVSDVGIIYELRKKYPMLDVHVSTQANVINSRSAKFFADLGVKRIVLARELSLEQIREIRKNIPKEVELEAFVHGSMCISYSGRCLLSNYLKCRDANHGECVQPCRWKYYVREEKRNDQMEVEEDERGTYIFSSKDLCLIDHLKELEDAGVNSLKIEGRMKTAYYVATVVNAYRRAIDMLPNKPTEELKKELTKMSHRKYITGFFDGTWGDDFTEQEKITQDYDFVGFVTGNENGYILANQRNFMKLGDEIEVLSPNDKFFNKKFTITEILDENGDKLEKANVAEQKIKIKSDLKLSYGDILRKRAK